MRQPGRPPTETIVNSSTPPLSNGEYEVRYIGVNWPHHIFVNQELKVVGAD